MIRRISSLFVLVLVAGLIPACGSTGSGETDVLSPDGSGGDALDGGDAVEDADDVAADIVDGDANTDAPDVCEASCEDLDCGPDGCGGTCGICATGLACTPGGQCEPTGEVALFGQACGPTADCHPEALSTEGGVWPACLHNQCATGACRVPACTRSCEMDRDFLDNATGEALPDGVEDAPFSSCGDAFDGPLGTSWKCVDTGGPLGDGGPTCIAGTDFRFCTHPEACPEGETCALLAVGGMTTARCLAAVPDAVPVGGDCGPEGEAPGLCADAPLCLEDGCTGPCVDGSDCLTAQASCVAGECATRPDVECDEDMDCSAWMCEARKPTEFTGSGLVGLCAPGPCERDGDCVDPSYRCRLAVGLPIGGKVDWDHRCAHFSSPSNAIPGEACSNDPSVGVVCDHSELCYKGQCGSLCTTDVDCAIEAGQVCAVAEIPFDVDGDGEKDQSLALHLCEPLPHSGELRECETNEDCADLGEICVPVELPAEDTSFAAYTLKRVCRVPPEGFGAYGSHCGLSPGEGECELGLCIVDDVDKVVDPLCSELCTGHASCPSIDLGGNLHPSVCRSVPYGFNETPDPADDLFVPVCWPVAEGSSLEECADTLECGEAGEVCTAWPIATDPGSPGSAQYLCVQHLALETSGAVGSVCEENADCESLLCLPGVGSKYCSALCVGDVDCLAGGPFMLCDAHVAIPRKSVAFDVVIDQCRLEKTCIPCSHHNDCTGDMRCVKLSGPGSGATYCAHPCVTNQDCAVTDGAAECSESQGPDGPEDLFDTCAPAQCP